MSTKFTPGPWRWWPCKDSSFKTVGDYAQIASGNVQVAKVQILSVTEEDLKLMAAAPELLAALVALLSMCERQNDFNDDGDGCMFERARAAIVKATCAA